VDVAAAQQWSDRLIDEFGSLPGVYAASQEARSRIVIGNDTALAAIEVVKVALLHVTTLRLKARPVLNTGKALYAYLNVEHAFCSIEVVRVLYLDVKLGLIKDEVIARGTLDQAAVFPQTIIRRALELNAGGILLIHNHPSGDPKPSKADIAITRALSAAGKPLDILLYDHVIVARGQHVSFRQEGLF
jgi:DNA repair protein RadC